ncbi:LexA family protein [Caldicellulosiruptor morganii]|uniref:DeoR family transcriptional regulator n=1 Tax=Caldicellulosiruptor morganii TaxID=1387555 RepID=A0ABY7BNH2_9FIRM|nr:DeoR family transcriptional regulator [Caldicellulosiruptor morganii]WAM33300.1 DeoR family transcriptional regulator [Caldicellulosiruptor morganii]
MLSERQRHILLFIKSFHEDKRYGPTIREIADGTGYSPTTVRNELISLEKSGFITREKGKYRTIVIN